MFGAITGVIGGFQAASAASNAADERVKGYVQSADTVDRTVAGVNPMIGGAYDQAGKVMLDASQAASENVNDAATNANVLLNPYINNGSSASTTLGEMFAPGGEGTKTFTSADMEADSGYQFRIDKAMQAMQRSAAARGGVMGGGALKALNREVQGVASSEYDAAFNRFRNTQNDRFTKLNTLAQTGLNASGTAGSNLTRASEVTGGYKIGGAKYSADAGTESARIQGGNSMNAGYYRADAERGAADARASEHLGRANAWNSVLTAAGGAADGFISGGLDGGGPFNLRDAFRGASVPNTKGLAV
jgi:hypothetical protein